MRERNIVLILAIVIIILGVLFSYVINSGVSSTGTSKFNFYSSNLEINNTKVTETLSYSPNKPYHTLFRNFVDKLAYSGSNTISIINVQCQDGTPYYRTYEMCYTFTTETTNECLPYTENNEYGCTFGNTLGFSTGKDYWIKSTYILNPSNLFLIKDKYYIKFVAYSPNNHIKLKTGSNLIVKGGITNNEYLPKNNVVIYIPFEGDTQGYNIIKKDNFEFDSSQFNSKEFFTTFIIFLIPLIVFIIIWLIFGRENLVPDVPDQLSQIPYKRKPWQVNAYFNPPFSDVSNGFYSTLMLDFFRRKIIDIKYIDNGLFDRKTLIKINPVKQDLDDIELNYLTLLKKLQSECSDDYKEGEYFDVIKASSQFFMRSKIRENLLDIRKSVKENGKEYIKVRGYSLFTGIILLSIIISFYAHLITLLVSSILLFIITLATHWKTPLLVKYNGDFYKEHKEWMAFKTWLSYSDSMKNSRSDAIVMWEEYLVYATALGVADKVLKQLKDLNIINDKQFRTYSGVYIASTGFSNSMASSGAHGGAGGGGVGGGGGGGR